MVGIFTPSCTSLKVTDRLIYKDILISGKTEPLVGCATDAKNFSSNFWKVFTDSGQF